MILPKTMREDIEEEKREETIIRLTRDLCHETKPTVKRLISIIHKIIKALEVWACGERDTPPYVEEMAWAEPFLWYLSRLNDSNEAHDENSKTFTAVNEVMGHLYESVGRTMERFGLDIANSSPYPVCAPKKSFLQKLFAIVPQHGKNEVKPEHCHAWWHRPNESKGTFHFHDFYIAHYILMLERLAEKPERRHAPDGSKLKLQYEELKSSIAKKHWIDQSQIIKGDVKKEKEEKRKTQKNDEWRKFLCELAADARNPMIRADVCVRWKDAKRNIGTRQTREMRDENFSSILNFVNKHRNLGDPIEWTWQAAEKWARRHPDTIKKFIRNPNL